FFLRFITCYCSSSSPSCSMTSISIATSLVLPLRDGPSHLLGQPSRNIHRSTELRDESSRTMEPLARCTVPSRTVLNQVHNDLSCVKPRFSVIDEYRIKPGSLRTVPALSLPSRYSMTSTSALRPDTSSNAALAMPSISTRKLKLDRKSTRLNSSHLVISYAVF